MTSYKSVASDQKAYLVQSELFPSPANAEITDVFRTYEYDGIEFATYDLEQYGLWLEKGQPIPDSLNVAEWHYVYDSEENLLMDLSYSGTEYITPGVGEYESIPINYYDDSRVDLAFAVRKSSYMPPSDGIAIRATNAVDEDTRCILYCQKNDGDRTVLEEGIGFTYNLKNEKQFNSIFISDIDFDADYKFDKRELRKQYLAFGALHSVMPLEIKRRTDAEWFRFPIEPIISISGKKTIIRRRPLKSTKGGTIKECWSDDDYSITIRGVITHPDDDSYPETIIKDLNRILDSVGEIRVLHQMLNAMGIDAIAIESVNFPHTKGLSNQNFEIKAFSDTPFELLQALKNPNQI